MTKVDCSNFHFFVFRAKRKERLGIDDGNDRDVQAVRLGHKLRAVWRQEFALPELDPTFCANRRLG